LAQPGPPVLPKHGGLAGLLVEAGAQVLALDTGSAAPSAEEEEEAETEAAGAGGEAETTAPAQRPSPRQQLMAWLGPPWSPSGAGGAAARERGCGGGGGAAGAVGALAARRLTGAEDSSAQQHNAVASEGPAPPAAPSLTVSSHATQNY
jgi:hypothetical protein